MKHIIIAGPGRCGKTTLSMRLSKLGLVHYKMDSIKRGIDKNFWDKYKSEWDIVSPKMAHLIGYIIKETESDIIRNTEFYCMDTCHLYPRDIYNEKLEDTIIVFLGFNKITKEEKLKYVRKYDNTVWTNSKSDEELLESLQSGIDFSVVAEKECQKYNIKYFDTSYDFDNVLDNVYEYIVNRLK